MDAICFRSRDLHLLAFRMANVTRFLISDAAELLGVSTGTVSGNGSATVAKSITAVVETPAYNP
jgi:hypothetical protein